MRRHEVIISPDALRDIEDIAGYINGRDGGARAEYVVDRIEAVIDSLALTPERGSYVPELLDFGSGKFRQTLFKPYRIIYRVEDKTVRVYLIADGRRNMPALLSRRLLG
jgi:toxin ParE1/3/4